MADLSIIWRCAGLLMAIEARSVVEILRPVCAREMPGAPAWVRGLFVYRGALIPLVDAARLLGLTPGPDRMANRVLVVRVRTVETAIDWPVGLWVESLLEIDRIEFAAAGSHPGFATAEGRPLGSVARTRWGQVQVVKAHEMFTAEQAGILTHRLTEAAA